MCRLTTVQTSADFAENRRDSTGSATQKSALGNTVNGG